MSIEWNALVTSFKALESRPEWDRDAHPTLLKFLAQLSIGGVVIGGLELRGAASKTVENRNVMFQLEHFPIGKKRTPLFRIEYRPFRTHHNLDFGPPELHWLEIKGTHDHPFEFNFIEQENRMRSGNLPVARPIDPDPNSFEDFLDLCSKRFNIANMGLIPPPKWQGDLFQV
ncbi:conserved hypothetical protein [Methylocella tundrae]|uniref:Uncharacterized protein n=1 Tax=Methylocella tundrae TaxID=227605 RepID=A0A8B6M4R0_METTU|nr:hypothetical protein [Methylocella tundrae]VTZ27192.1 conserved hypothetical protein [Methylocella tundrae]VTZ49814.1 conserved hypothetical protein [Methylocella tundrae]